VQHPVLISMFEAQLHCPKQAGGAGYGCSHEVELAQHALPLLLNADPVFTSQVIEDLLHLFLSAFGELHGPIARVENPTQYLLLLAPSPVTLVKLFLQHCLLPVQGLLILHHKDPINGMQYASSGVPAE
jgi:hypothetical protein